MAWSDGRMKERGEHELAQVWCMVFFSLGLDGEYIRLAFRVASWRDGSRVGDVCARWLGALFGVSKMEKRRQE